MLGELFINLIYDVMVEFFWLTSVGSESNILCLALVINKKKHRFFDGIIFSNSLMNSMNYNKEFYSRYKMEWKREECKISVNIM